jgi:hypothetical protein
MTLDIHVLATSKQIVVGLDISFDLNSHTHTYHDICRSRGRHGRDHIVVGFTTTCAISAYHH